MAAILYSCFIICRVIQFITIIAVLNKNLLISILHVMGPKLHLSMMANSYVILRNYILNLNLAIRYSYSP